MTTLPLVYSPEVAAARASGAPLVALESTIITHGMPWPDNVATAEAVETEVRNAGAVPATVAVIDGALHVGLSSPQIAGLGRGKDIAKLSRADIAAALATRRSGGTTVSATMIAARVAGVDVFATGGIGGVHRGAEHSFDISADLQELAQTPVTVVCAGAKAILDLPKTLEVLESLGVPVISVGQDDFAAFWSRQSGLPAPLRIDSDAQIARAHLMRRRLGVPGGQLVAVPIPAMAEIPAAEMAPVIAAAQAAADAAGITGKKVTPFLLDRIGAATGGRALGANIALVRNNARRAAAIATQIAHHRRASTL